MCKIPTIGDSDQYTVSTQWEAAHLGFAYLDVCRMSVGLFNVTAAWTLGML